MILAALILGLLVGFVSGAAFIALAQAGRVALGTRRRRSVLRQPRILVQLDGAWRRR